MPEQAAKTRANGRSLRPHNQREAADVAATHQAANTGLTLVDAATIARKLSLPESWVREHCRARCPVEDRIPHVRFGKYIRFLPADIDQWLIKRAKTKF